MPVSFPPVGVQEDMKKPVIFVDEVAPHIPAPILEILILRGESEANKKRREQKDPSR